MEEKESGKYGILERFFQFLDKRPNLVILLLTIGVILITEGFIFIYATLNRWFDHLPLLALFLVFSSGLIDLFVISSYIKNRGVSLVGEDTHYSMAPYLKKIDRYFPISNRYVSVFTGLAIVVFAFVHPLFGIGKGYIGDADIILILTGGFLMSYTFIPEKFNIERDFILTFFVFLMIFMAIVPELFDLLAGSFEYYFLTLPLHHVVSWIGINNWMIGYNEILFYYRGAPIPIQIARSCSGIYSFSIFTSAFIAFALVIYRKIDLKSTLFMGLGIFLAYIGNIVRMTIVVASGKYYGPRTMVWVHENVGYIIFLLWMTFFWILLYKFLMKGNE
jgi:archaeosortase C (PEF-CTERM variant)